LQNQVTCDLRDGILIASIGYNVESSPPVIQGIFAPGTMYIKDIYNPSVPTTYTFNYYLVTGTSILEWGQASLTLSSFTISNFFIYTPYLTASAKMPFFINFTNPIPLADGYFSTAEPSKTTVYIDIGFRMLNFPNTWFAYDFGTNQNNGQIDCDIYGVQVTPFANSLQCILIQGPSLSPSNSDLVFIRIANYGPVLIGTTFAINIPGTFCQSKLLVYDLFYSCW
jgi:hypothetical protein